MQYLYSLFFIGENSMQKLYHSTHSIFFIFFNSLIVVKCVLFWGGLVSKYKGFVGCKKKRLRFILFWFCFGTLKKLHSFVHAIISEKRILKKNYSLSWNKDKHQKIWNSQIKIWIRFNQQTVNITKKYFHFCSLN